MNQKFVNFNKRDPENEDKIIKVPVKAHIYDNTGLVNNNTESIDTTGSIVIVDNTGDPKIESILSDYALFIDNVHIASGYGFKSVDDVRNVIDKIREYQENNEIISEKLDELTNKSILIKVGQKEIDDVNILENYLSPTYNKYGYITSYKYFTIEQVNDNNNNITNFILYLNEQTDISYVDNISLKYANEYIDLPESDEFDVNPFNLKVCIKQHTGTYKLPFNNNLDIIIKSSLNEYVIHTADNNDSSSYEIDYSFNKPINEFRDKLEIIVKYKYNDNNDQELDDEEDENQDYHTINIDKSFYRHIYKDILKWMDQFTYGIEQSLNDINFKDSQLNIAENSYVQEYIFKCFNGENVHFMTIDDFDKEIELTFETDNNSSYDYVIFKNDYNTRHKIEFYFNGILSKNWTTEIVNVNGTNYYIWQSPQIYYGLHTWKIIIRR